MAEFDRTLLDWRYADDPVALALIDAYEALRKEVKVVQREEDNAHQLAISLRTNLDQAEAIIKKMQAEIGTLQRAPLQKLEDYVMPPMPDVPLTIDEGYFWPKPAEPGPNWQREYGAHNATKHRTKKLRSQR